MSNISPEAVLRRRQIAYDNLKKQMDERQDKLEKLRSKKLVCSLERATGHKNQFPCDCLASKQSDLARLIKEENAQIVRIAKDLCILEDRGCR